MKKQPNSSKCFVCGVENTFGLHMKFYSDGDDSVVSEFLVPEQYQGYPGVVHGGIIAAMLDEVSGRVFMNDDHNKFYVTAELKIRYRKPVPTGETLILRGKRDPDGGKKGRVAFATGEIWNKKDELLASADIVVVEIPENIKQDFEQDSSGWKIYPD